MLLLMIINLLPAAIRPRLRVPPPRPSRVHLGERSGGGEAAERVQGALCVSVLCLNRGAPPLQRKCGGPICVTPVSGR